MQMRSQEHHVHTRDGFEGDASTIDGTCRVRARRTEAKKSRAERRPARALAENVNCQILACERFVRASLLPTLRIYSTWTCSPSIALQHLAAIIRVIGSSSAPWRNQSSGTVTPETHGERTTTGIIASKQHPSVST
jgi:hypothetical protein